MQKSKQTKTKNQKTPRITQLLIITHEKTLIKYGVLICILLLSLYK